MCLTAGDRADDKRDKTSRSTQNPAKLLIRFLVMRLNLGLELLLIVLPHARLTSAPIASCGPKATGSRNKGDLWNWGRSCSCAFGRSAKFRRREFKSVRPAQQDQIER